jgi:ABC-type transporter Mla subunit MlaD
MKKKIINGILMVALVAATSTSFVSCKDTSEDVKTDLMAQVNAVKANLEPRVQQAESDIANLQGRMTTAESDIATLKQDVADIKEDIAELDTRVGDLEEATEDLEKRMNTVEDRISTIVDALQNMVTSVNVNATSTNMLLNSKLFPGLNIQFLGAAYGQAVNPGSFPSTDKDDYIAGHGVVLSKNDIKAVDGAIDWKANAYLPVEEEGAGTVYFTLNPSNIDALNAERLTLSLVNSQNEESFVTLGKVEKDSTTVLEWGLTRAEFQPTLWKAEAAIDFEAAEIAKKAVDPTQIIDFKDIAGDFRTLVTDAYHSAQDANRNNYAETAKSATKELVKNSAAIVAKLLQTEIPGLPALALKAEWEDTVGVRSVLSDYSIAATAYKPLSFGFGAELGIDGRQISLDKIDNVVARIIDKLKAKLNTVDLTGVTIKSFDLSGVTKTVTVTIPIGYIDGVHPTTAKDLTTTLDQIDDIEDAVNAMGIDEINNMIQDVQKLINDVNSYADRTKNFEVRVSNFLERYINKVITKIANDGLTRVLEPVMLYQGSEGVNRLATGASFKAGEYDLIPTTMTYETIAPAYKKYVAVIGKDGKVRTAEIKTNGQKNFKKFTVTLEEGDQAIVYDALDFSGKQIAKKYAINVVK